MGCPGCGSNLWTGEKCPACGRLASDTSRRLGDHPLPAEAARQAVAKGAFGGAVAGYLGGGPFDLSQFGNQVLLGAALGTALGLVAVLLLWFAAGDRDWSYLWFVPAASGGAALLFGVKELLDWAVGWAAAPWGKGLAAAAVGAVIGGILAAAGAYAVARRREARRTTKLTCPARTGER